MRNTTISNSPQPVITKKDIETFFAALKDEHGVNEAQLINYRIDDSVLFELKSMHKVAPTQTSALTHAPNQPYSNNVVKLARTSTPQAAHEAKWQTKNLKPENTLATRFDYLTATPQMKRIAFKTTSNAIS